MKWRVKNNEMEKKKENNRRNQNVIRKEDRRNLILRELRIDVAYNFFLLYHLLIGIDVAEDVWTVYP